MMHRKLHELRSLHVRMSMSVLCACQVMAEGTLEAAMEAPHMFAASDALAARAAAWTERRQRLRIDAAPADGPELQDAHEAGAAAAAEVKKVGS